MTSWIEKLRELDVSKHEIALLGRSSSVVERCKRVALPFEDEAGRIECLDMHKAKGLEFREVAILGCDDGTLPDEERLLEATDEAAIDEIMATERHLLYVAFSRAREWVWLSSSGRPSEFIADLLE